MSGVAVYHPSINLPRGDWLQLSLLYWERLLRVVPAEYSKPVPREIEELEAADLVRRWDPDPARRDASACFLDALASREDELVSLYRLGTGSAWHNAGGEPWETDPGITYIHAGKLTRELGEDLVDAGLALRDPDGWFGLHPRLGRTYMAVLVEHIGRESGANPITDDPIAHVLGSEWTSERVALALTSPLFPARDTFEPPRAAASLALISIQAAVPFRPLAVSEIVEVRAQLGEELWRFRQLLVTVVHEAGVEATSPEALQMHLEDLYRIRVAPEVRRLRHDLKLCKVETAYAVVNLRTTLPSALTLAATQLGFHDPALSTGAAVAVSLLGLRQEVQLEKRAALATSPAAFLWSLEDRFGRDMTGVNAKIEAAARTWSQRP